MGDERKKEKKRVGEGERIEGERIERIEGKQRVREKETETETEPETETETEPETETETETEKRERVESGGRERVESREREKPGDLYKYTLKYPRIDLGMLLVCKVYTPITSPDSIRGVPNAANHRRRPIVH
eukprot:1392124-Amorphochlora_amoeboformis.AAC.1